MTNKYRSMTVEQILNEGNTMKYGTPTEQHKAHAEKILARRARGSSNETEGEDTPIKEEVPTDPTPIVPTEDDVQDVPETDEEEVPTEDVPETDEEETSYEGLGIKDLRKLCDDEGISYKKKDTIPKLIAKLEAE